jgi:uncharacterized protein YndB with AHSA1/START domain
MNFEKIQIETIVNQNINKVWMFWTSPEHIVKWNAASDDWHTTKATNDLKVGGKFTSRMEAKDGSFGFDFEGEYQVVEIENKLAYTMEDGRQVEVVFKPLGHSVQIIETFDAETENSLEMQKTGWQAILNNFKQYAESY